MHPRPRDLYEVDQKGQIALEWHVVQVAHLPLAPGVSDLLRSPSNLLRKNRTRASAPSPNSLSLSLTDASSLESHQTQDNPLVWKEANTAGSHTGRILGVKLADESKNIRNPTVYPIPNLEAPMPGDGTSPMGQMGGGQPMQMIDYGCYDGGGGGPMSNQIAMQPGPTGGYAPTVNEELQPVPSYGMAPPPPIAPQPLQMQPLHPSIVALTAQQPPPSSGVHAAGAFLDQSVQQNPIDDLPVAGAVVRPASEPKEGAIDNKFSDAAAAAAAGMAAAAAAAAGTSPNGQPMTPATAARWEAARSLGFMALADAAAS